jgi:hypothetical protein
VSRYLGDTKENMSEFSSVELSSCHSGNTQNIIGLTILTFKEPPRVDHLDVVGRLTPSMNGHQEFTAPRSLVSEPGRAVALGRVLVLT